MNKIIKDNITRRVEEKIEELFNEIAREYHLTSGDVDILDSVDLWKAEERLVEIVFNYVESNKKGQ